MEPFPFDKFTKSRILCFFKLFGNLRLNNFFLSFIKLFLLQHFFFLITAFILICVAGHKLGKSCFQGGIPQYCGLPNSNCHTDKAQKRFNYTIKIKLRSFTSNVENGFKK